MERRSPLETESRGSSLTALFDTFMGVVDDDTKQFTPGVLPDIEEVLTLENSVSGADWALACKEAPSGLSGRVARVSANMRQCKSHQIIPLVHILRGLFCFVQSGALTDK